MTVVPATVVTVTVVPVTVVTVTVVTLTVVTVTVLTVKLVTVTEVTVTVVTVTVSDGVSPLLPHITLIRVTNRDKYTVISYCFYMQYDFILTLLPCDII